MTSDYLLMGNILNTTNPDDDLDCAAECLADVDCLAFSYYFGVCSLYDATFGGGTVDLAVAGKLFSFYISLPEKV